MDFIYPVVLFATLGGVCILLTTHAMPQEERRPLITILVAALIVRMVAASMFALVPSTRLFHEDADGYEILGMAKALYWHGEGPPIEAYIAFGQNNGWRVAAAFIYYVFGQYQSLVSFFNCVVGTVTVTLVYRLARQFFHPLVARRAALLTAFMPSIVLWSATALKDAPMGLLILVALFSCVSLKRRFSFWPLVGVVASLAAIQTIRFYMLYFLGFAIVMSLFLERGVRMVGGIYKQVFLLGAVAALLVMVGLSSRVESGTELLSLENVSSFRHGMAVTARSGFAADADISTPGRALAFLPIGLSELLLGPFPWQWGSLRALFAAPETIYWWLMFPSVLRGIVWSARRRFAATSPLIIFVVIMSCAYSLVHGNVGSGFRQRAQIFIIFFIFAAFGLYRRRAERANIEPSLLLAPETA